MKKNLCAITMMLLVCAACNKTDLQNTTQQPDAVATKAKSGTQSPINFTAPNVFPEGVVYDPFHDRFLVSSLSQGTIGSVSPDGMYTPFIQDDALISTTGLEIDKARKRLLVSNNGMNGAIAQLAIYDLNTGNRIRLVDLGALLPGAHFINDVALDPNGNAYVTDSFMPVIYKVDVNGTASVFFQNADFALPPGSFGFNGIEYHNNGFLLVSVTARNQVIKIPVDGSNTYSIVQLESLNRPDGLLLSNNGKQLIVVNNANGSADGKVLSFESSDKWTTGSANGSFSTGAVFPTTATGDKKTVYVLYSYLHRLMSGQPQQTFTIQPISFEENQPF